ncbi:hypothetical protein NV379_02525 [Paenibacillus sp. N1-5-1-14]|uniref:hypothetical protein n=1 Tax=Paenibacillus radicibacter TaxID=2972488 RepID=UPI002159327B|nr:hypothetical protein [Paenibacillus radicibacter]MCR8641522.1 hypothetical protein [Paenibacillus radicibacter]
MTKVKMVWGMFKGQEGTITKQQGKNLIVKLEAGFEIDASSGHVEEIEQYELVLVRTSAGTKTHVAKKYNGSSHLFVGCGVVKNCGTRLICLKGEVDIRTITCEKCREKYELQSCMC